MNLQSTKAACFPLGALWPMVKREPKRTAMLIAVSVCALTTAAYLHRGVTPEPSYTGNRLRVVIDSNPDLYARHEYHVASTQTDSLGIYMGLNTPRLLPADVLGNAVIEVTQAEAVSYPKGEVAERMFDPIVMKAANQHKVDPALIKAIIFAESGYNALAVSKKGARGLMQLMPKTAESLGVEDCFNPEQNIFGGVKYLKKLITYFNGDITLAVAAYNSGLKTVRKHQGVPPIKATRHYLAKVMKYYQIYKDRMARA